jgi:hypothetical protein
MAEIAGRVTANHIQVAFASRIPYPGALAAFERQRMQWVVGAVGPARAMGRESLMFHECRLSVAFLVTPRLQAVHFRTRTRTQPERAVLVLEK